MDISLFDYVANVNNANTNNASGSDYTAKYSNFNFDIGAVKKYGDAWRTGLVVKNAIPHTYDFKRAPTPGAIPVSTGASLNLKPQVRIGASHSNSWSTVAMDLDLTRNDPAGLEKKSQYLSLGGELNAWGWAQLRAGYRANLADSARNIASIGIGLAPFTVIHFDAAIARSANEIGASLQLGIKW